MTTHLKWTDYPSGSVREDGAKVGEFCLNGGFEWWAYPPGWVHRGTVDALGPFQSLQEAKDAMTSWLGVV